MKVLVTGAFGWTAKSIIEKLYNNKYQVVAFDISKDVPEYLKKIAHEIHIGDVSKEEDIKKAMIDCDYIIHLAVAIGESDYKTANIPFKVNVEGTYNMFKVANEFNVKKVILMSEAPVHLEIPKEKSIDDVDWKSSDDGDHLYDLTKRLQESIAKDFSDTFNLNVTVLRPGHIVDGKEGIDPSDRTLEDLFYCRGGWICKYDLAEVCLKALETKLPKYSIFNIIGSYQSREYFNLVRTENELNMKFEELFNNYHIVK